MWKLFTIFPALKARFTQYRRSRFFTLLKARYQKLSTLTNLFFFFWRLLHHQLQRNWRTDDGPFRALQLLRGHEGYQRASWCDFDQGDTCPTIHRLRIDSFQVGTCLQTYVMVPLALSAAQIGPKICGDRFSDIDDSDLGSMVTSELLLLLHAASWKDGLLWVLLWAHLV